MDEDKLTLHQEQSRTKFSAYEWRSMHSALSQVKKFYQGVGFSETAAEVNAKRAILRRLEKGGAFSKISGDNAVNQYYCVAYAHHRDKPRKPREFNLSDGTQAKIFGVIPITFWRFLNRSEKLEECDWWAGDFVFSYFDSQLDAEISGKALNVEVTICKLPGFTEQRPLRTRRHLSREDMKLPPVAEAALVGWWASLDRATKKMSHAKLVEVAKSAFPGKFVSRDRVRALDPGRKPGPKPISDKTSAE